MKTDNINIAMLEHHQNIQFVYVYIASLSLCVYHISFSDDYINVEIKLHLLLQLHHGK